MNEVVVLLHGLGRRFGCMNKIKNKLVSEGYEVINIGYPSTTDSIEVLSERILKRISNNNKFRNASKVHFVGTSLGAILIRMLLNKKKFTNIGNVVMISPPNHGSEIVDFFMGNIFLKNIFSFVMGKAGSQLGTNDESLPNILGPANYPLGIIAGKSKGFFSMLFNGPNDGKVSVESSKLEGMKEFIIVPYGHTFIMEQKMVINKVVNFIKCQKF